MRWIYRVIMSLVLVLFGILLLNDFFSSFKTPFGLTANQVFLIMILLVIISGYIERKLGEKSKWSNRTHLIMTYSLLAILAILTLLGGESESGIGINSPLIWIAFAIQLFIDYKNRKRKSEPVDMQ